LSVEEAAKKLVRQGGTNYLRFSTRAHEPVVEEGVTDWQRSRAERREEKGRRRRAHL
jgi:hypothetical protein